MTAMEKDKDIKDAPPPAEDTAPKVHKTTGEKWFNLVRFTTGEVFILGLTAGLAYVAKYGEKSYLGVPNVLKSMEEWTTKKLMPKNPDTNEFGVRLAGALGSATVLMHGGNLFVPVMKGLQDHRAHIVADFNKRFGRPGEVEAGNDRLKHETKESWGDVIKGRLASYAVVFGSFLAADMVAGKKTLPDGRIETRFDLLKDKVGRMVAGLTKDGKEIAATPVVKKLTEEQFHNKSYRFGKILALDVFATTAALAIWSTVSKFSAIARGKKVDVAEEAGKDLQRDHAQEAQQPVPNATIPSVATPEPEKTVAFADRIGDRPADFRGLAEKEPASSTMALS